MKRPLFPLLCLMLLPGCAAQPRLPADAHPCTEPRPQACTMDYRPVCALHRDGRWHTAGNACSACGDATVLGWRQGECSTAD